MAARICGRKWVGVTKLMLCTPCDSSRINFAASSPVVRSLPFANWLMGKFWQNLQWREQPERKIVPDPLDPANAALSGQAVHPASMGTEIATLQPSISQPDPLQQLARIVKFYVTHCQRLRLSIFRKATPRLRKSGGLTCFSPSSPR